MMHQICHQRPIVNASISRKLAPSLIDELDWTNPDFQQEQLLNNGVGYIVIHNSTKNEGRILDRKTYLERYRLLFSDDHYTILGVR